MSLCLVYDLTQSKICKQIRYVEVRVVFMKNMWFTFLKIKFSHKCFYYWERYIKMTEDISVMFLIPKDCQNENECSEEMKLAFLVSENQ